MLHLLKYGDRLWKELKSDVVITAISYYSYILLQLLNIVK